MLVLLDPKYGEQTATNYFMDGPYFFNLQKREKDRITIQFIKRVDESETTEVIPSVTITLAEYGDALLSLSEGIIKDPNFRWLEKEQTRINFERSVARLRVML